MLVQRRGKAAQRKELRAIGKRAMIEAAKALSEPRGYFSEDFSRTWTLNKVLAPPVNLPPIPRV
jgi:stage V sporulation protein SpoVS